MTIFLRDWAFVMGIQWILLTNGQQCGSLQFSSWSAETSLEYTGYFTPCCPSHNNCALMMTSSNVNIFRVTGHLCEECEFAAQRPVTRSFDVFFELCLHKWLSKRSWGWWFETRSCSLWRLCNVLSGNHMCYSVPSTTKATTDTSAQQITLPTTISATLTQCPGDLCRSQYTLNTGKWAIFFIVSFNEHWWNIRYSFYVLFSILFLNHRGVIHYKRLANPTIKGMNRWLHPDKSVECKYSPMDAKTTTVV